LIVFLDNKSLGTDLLETSIALFIKIIRDIIKYHRLKYFLLVVQYIYVFAVDLASDFFFSGDLD